MNSFSIIIFLLILSPLITEGMRISKLETRLNDVSIAGHKKYYLKRDLLITAISGSDSSIEGTGDSYNKPIESQLLLANRQSEPTKIANNKIEPKSSDSRYQALAIVWSVCAVIVLSIGLTVVYIQFRRGNNSSQEILNRNGIQLNSISNTVNLDLDLMSGTHYLNTGIMAFNDISSEILTAKHNNNNKSQKTLVNLK